MSDAGSPVVIELADLAGWAGKTVGHSSWRRVTQDDVDTFARLTGDEQWIHVDPERAKSGPFGTTIAHGYFTLALSTEFLYELVTIEGAGMILNYGSDRVRYPSPLPVDSMIRALVEIPTVTSIPGGFQVVYRLTYEREGGTKPVCVADILFRYYESGPGAAPPS
ncbi:MAG TPA: MaoC family dehydratase [Acidimicrobiales bacterium]|nr:MaoC family dehydratase [Acidimicrobiales bacterium]